MVPYLLFFVDDPARSARGLSTLVGIEPVEVSPTFALFALSGARLGLWRREGVQPPVAPAGENAELAFAVDGEAEVERLHERWLRADATILQPPTRLDFGYAVTAALPGPMRVRAYHPAGGPG